MARNLAQTARLVMSDEQVQLNLLFMVAPTRERDKKSRNLNQGGLPSRGGRGMIDRHSSSSTWAPLRFAVFRWLWLASLVSNVGTWMQTVGAQWILVHAAHAAILVSLVQTADMLPDVLFGIVGGVLADTLDRRRLLMAVQGGLVVATSGLAAFTFAGRISPGLLLMFTFVIGTGSVLVTPAYQSLVPELVPHDQIPAAAQLSSISVNIARAIGPAAAGILIAHIGVGAVFALDAATFLFYGVVAALWRPPAEATPQIPERFVSALRAGGRYVRYAPVVRRIMFRATLFLVPASALWALLPIVASRSLRLGPSGYGLLLGALGVGAIAGALVLSRLRSRNSTSPLIALIGVVYGAVLVAVTLVHTTIVVVLLLIPAGIAWVAMLATVNTLLQLFLPRWVPGTRAFGVPDGALRGPRPWGGRVGPCCRRVRAHTHFPCCRRHDGRRRGLDSRLAACRHFRHGPAHAGPARSKCRARDRCRSGPDRGQNDLHDPGWT